MFAIIVFLVYSTFYHTMLFKGVFSDEEHSHSHARILEKPANWIEPPRKEPESSLALRFGENIHTWQEDDSKALSYRFWAGLMMFSLWMHLFDMLKLGNLYGTSMAIVN